MKREQALKAVDVARANGMQASIVRRDQEFGYKTIAKLPNGRFVTTCYFDAEVKKGA